MRTEKDLRRQAEKVEIIGLLETPAELSLAFTTNILQPKIMSRHVSGMGSLDLYSTYNVKRLLGINFLSCSNESVSNLLGGMESLLRRRCHAAPRYRTCPSHTIYQVFSWPVRSSLL